MIPLRDSHRVKVYPLITNALIVINCIVFLIMVTMNVNDIIPFIETYAVIPYEVIHGNMLMSVFTSMFLHAGFLHIGSNMLFLHIFGPSLEEWYGHFKFLAFYLICGAISVACQVFSTPDSYMPMLGASGAISGLLGGYIFLFPHHKVDVIFPAFWFMGTSKVPAGIMLLYWFVTQYVFGIQAMDIPGEGGVAYFAHIGGFVAGLLLTPLLSVVVKRKPTSAITVS